MIVSTKGRYALRVMIDLAEHQAERYVPLKEVAERQEISEKYLESILVVLSKAGAIDALLDDIAAGRKYMKVYKQMKMYNDPELNPVLYASK